MTEFIYDATYEPAMPVCSVTIASAATGRHETFNAIMDTGADATIVPTRLLRHIGARRVFETGLRSQWGERRSVYLYLVDLEINGVTLPGIYVVGDEVGDEVVLGRNALNKLVVTLDGPRKAARVEA
jgi:hypothetical protein